MNYAMTAAAEEAGASEVGPDGTKGLFYRRPVLNEAQSQVEGRPIFDVVPYLKMRFPGEGKSVVDRKVRDGDRNRFPRAWAAFEAGLAGLTSGTPIETMPLLGMDQVATLKYLGIITAEQLAEVPDSKLSQLGSSGQALRDRAKAWLQGDTAEVKTIRKQLLESNKRVDLLEAEISVLKTLMAKPASDKAA